MELKSLVSLSVFVIATLVANFFFKSGATAVGTLSFSLETLWKAAVTPAVVAGVLTYAIAAIAWFVSLSLVPLNIASSVSAMVYVLIVLLAFLVFRENIPFVRWVGIVLIASGMFLVGRST